MIVIRVDRKTALLLVLGVAVLVVNFSQAYGLMRDLVPLVRSIHFNLVQAPLESAINAGKKALDDLSGE